MATITWSGLGGGTLPNQLPGVLKDVLPPRPDQVIVAMHALLVAAGVRARQAVRLSLIHI